MTILLTILNHQNSLEVKSRRYGSNNKIFFRHTDRITDKARYRVTVQLTIRGAFLGGHHL